MFFEDVGLVIETNELRNETGVKSIKRCFDWHKRLQNADLIVI